MFLAFPAAIGTQGTSSSAARSRRRTLPRSSAPAAVNWRPAVFLAACLTHPSRPLPSAALSFPPLEFTEDPMDLPRCPSVLVREDGFYVADMAVSTKSYTRDLTKAKIFDDLAAARRDACGNETARTLASQLRLRTC